MTCILLSASVTPAGQSSSTNPSANHALLADALTRGHQNAVAKRKRAQDEAQLARHARNSVIPAPTTSIAKSIIYWVKVMLGIHVSGSRLPDPPTLEELAGVLTPSTEYRRRTGEAVRQSIDSARENAGGSLSAPHEAFLRRQIFSELDSSAPTTSYNLSSSQSSGNFEVSQEWISHCHAILQRAGFARCTFAWESHADSAWNARLIAILSHSWNLCLNQGGMAVPAFVKEDNTEAKRIAIITRWFNTKKGQWRAGRRRASLDESLQPEAGQSGPRRLADKARARVSLLQSCPNRTVS